MEDEELLDKIQKNMIKLESLKKSDNVQNSKRFKPLWLFVLYFILIPDDMEEDFDNEDMLEQQGLVDIILPPQIISDPLHQIKFQEIKSIIEEANSLSDYIK